MMSDRNMRNDNRIPEQIRQADTQLDELFLAYREACPDPEPSVNFTPELWARIEAREVSTNLFGRMAKALVTAALAATVILGLMVSTFSHNESQFNGTYIEALRADRASSLEPLNLDRFSELEQH
jgi:anti-sigma-K factor RskA